MRPVYRGPPHTQYCPINIYQLQRLNTQAVYVVSSDLSSQTCTCTNKISATYFPGLKLATEHPFCRKW
ncbi:rCG24207 [Rattus norvegicus]|uniref:RCG24207 n=1 Tax=Rattus norvegicus TaxID=10116 RepID=A6KAM6_RAT|nr:rCG24207 [Rattus norvegicus]